MTSNEWQVLSELVRQHGAIGVMNAIVQLCQRTALRLGRESIHWFNEAKAVESRIRTLEGASLGDVPPEAPGVPAPSFPEMRPNLDLDIFMGEEGVKSDSLTLSQLTKGKWGG